MLTAMYSVRNIVGERIDTWDVNVEQDYHEESKGSHEESKGSHEESKGSMPGGDRMVPQRLSAGPDEDALRSAFARYDAVALGAAVGIVLGLGIFVATSLLLLLGGDPLGPRLSLLGNYFLGFQVSWGGSLLGLAEAGGFGFVFGYSLAKLINSIVGLHERRLMRMIERLEAHDLLSEL